MNNNNNNAITTVRDKIKDQSDDAPLYLINSTAHTHAILRNTFSKYDLLKDLYVQFFIDCAPVENIKNLLIIELASFQ